MIFQSSAAPSGCVLLWKIIKYDKKRGGNIKKSLVQHITPLSFQSPKTQVSGTWPITIPIFEWSYIKHFIGHSRLNCTRQIVTDLDRWQTFMTLKISGIFDVFLMVSNSMRSFPLIKIGEQILLTFTGGAVPHYLILVLLSSSWSILQFWIFEYQIRIPNTGGPWLTWLWLAQSLQ